MVTGNPVPCRMLWAMAFTCALSAAVASGQVKLGASFPALSGKGLTGAVPDTRGRVAIIDFWASWCAPCKASFPVYSEIQRDFLKDGLVVIGVGVDEVPSAYAAFVARLKPTFATVHDSRRLMVALVQVPTMPTSYVLDRAGNVRFVHAGFHGEETERELRREVGELLAEKEALR